MHPPHPPATSRTRDVPNIKSRTKLPGMADPLRPNENHLNQSNSKQLSSGTNVNGKVDLHQLHRQGGSINRLSNPGKIHPDSKIPSLNHIRGGDRRDSFSKYKLLPDITSEKSESKSCKRTFATWCTEDESTLRTSEKDDILSDTIKKMKLGTGILSGDDISLSDNEVDRKLLKNPFDKTKRDLSQSDSVNHTIELIIRLPDGEREQHCFSSMDTLGTIIDYLSKVMGKKIDLNTYVLYTNEVPKKEIEDSKSPLVYLGIHNKSVIALERRDLP